MGDMEKEEARSEKSSRLAPFAYSRRALSRTDLAVPEVLVLLDASGLIARIAALHAGERLSGLDIRAGVSLHDALHPTCDGEDCELLTSWQEAWERQQAGLAVEFEGVLHGLDTAVKIRVQPVNYACAELFGGALKEFHDHSVVFLQDITRSFSLWEDLYEAVKASRRPRLELSSDTDTPMQVKRHDRGLNAEVSALVLRVLETQEAERRRIRAELHDGLGQTLSLLRFEIEGLREGLVAGRMHDKLDAIARVHDYVRRCQIELRQVTQDLKPSLLAELGLRRALETLCADINLACPNVQIDLDLSDEADGLSDDLSVAIYRVAQEALTNMARHSRASKAVVAVAIDGDHVKLTVSDDGVGMPDKVLPRRGLGMRTMRERTESLGGRFVFASRPSGGCLIAASWSSAGA